MKEVMPRWPFLSTFHLIRHYSHQKQQNTTLFKGWRQELSPGEPSSCRNTVAVTGAKCRPPGGATVLRHQLIGTSFQRYHRGFADAQTKDILQREMGMACPHWLVRNKTDQRRSGTRGGWGSQQARRKTGPYPPTPVTAPREEHIQTNSRA